MDSDAAKRLAELEAKIKAEDERIQGIQDRLGEMVKLLGGTEVEFARTVVIFTLNGRQYRLQEEGDNK